MGFNPTKEQFNVLAAIQDGQDNIFIRARAGSGKTTLIVEAAKYAPANSIFLAFNKKIATELDARLPSNCLASTFNAYCYQFLKGRLPRGLKVDGYKTLNYIKNSLKDAEDVKWEVQKAVSIAKNYGMGIFDPITKEGMLDIIEEFDITPGETDLTQADIARFAVKVLKANERDLSTIDFDDQLYLTLKFVLDKNWALPFVSWCFVDEYQDTNPVQNGILEQMGCRIIAVGDDKQAIYGFRGAGVNAIEDAIHTFGFDEYPLTISFRCPHGHVEHVNKIVPDLRSKAGAIEGFIGDCDIKGLENVLGAGDMVMCRNNYPLFSVALKMLKLKRPFTIGDKFTKQLIGFVKRFKAKNVKEFRVSLAKWRDEEIEKARAKKKYNKIEQIEDKFESLNEIQKYCTSVDGIVETLYGLLNSKNGAMLTTVHGAKGLEANRTFILRPDLMPSEYAVRDWEIEQEHNIMYVAQTRSLNEMWFCHQDFGDAVVKEVKSLERDYGTEF